MPSLNPLPLAPESTLDLGAACAPLSVGQHALKRSWHHLVPCQLQVGTMHPVLMGGAGQNLGTRAGG